MSGCQVTQTKGSLDLWIESSTTPRRIRLCKNEIHLYEKYEIESDIFNKKVNVVGRAEQ